MTVRVNGAVPVNNPTDSVAPDGIEVKVRSTAFGSSIRVTVADAPFESVAVRLSCRYEGYT